MRINKVLFVSAVLLCFSASSAFSYILRKDIHRNIKADSSLEFRLENKFGSVSLEGYHGCTIDIIASFKVRAPSKSNAREIFNKIDLNLSNKNGEISIHPDLPKVRQTGLFSFTQGVRTTISIDYRVLLPLGTDVKVNILNGDITANNLESPYVLKTGFGNIDIVNSVSKSGRAEISRGNIRCELFNPGWNGDLRLWVGSGEISLFLTERINAVLAAKSDKGRFKLNLDSTIKPEIEKYDRVEISFGSGEGSINIDNIRGEVILKSVE